MELSEMVVTVSVRPLVSNANAPHLAAHAGTRLRGTSHFVLSAHRQHWTEGRLQHSPSERLFDASQAGFDGRQTPLDTITCVSPGVIGNRSVQP